MSKFSAFAFILIFICFSSCSKDNKTPSITTESLDKIEKQQTTILKLSTIDPWLSKGADSLSVLYFYADWCKICQKFRPVLLNVLSEKQLPVRIGLINSDQQKSAINRFGITSLPTIKIFKNGNLLYTSVGFLQEKELKTIFNKFITPSK